MKLTEPNLDRPLGSVYDTVTANVWRLECAGGKVTLAPSTRRPPPMLVYLAAGLAGGAIGFWGARHIAQPPWFVLPAAGIGSILIMLIAGVLIRWRWRREQEAGPWLISDGRTVSLPRLRITVNAGATVGFQELLVEWGSGQDRGTNYELNLVCFDATGAQVRYPVLHAIPDRRTRKLATMLSEATGIPVATVKVKD